MSGLVEGLLARHGCVLCPDPASNWSRPMGRAGIWCLNAASKPCAKTSPAAMQRKRCRCIAARKALLWCSKAQPHYRTVTDAVLQHERCYLSRCKLNCLYNKHYKERYRCLHTTAPIRQPPRWGARTDAIAQRQQHAVPKEAENIGPTLIGLRPYWW